MRHFPRNVPALMKKTRLVHAPMHCSRLANGTHGRNMPSTHCSLLSPLSSLLPPFYFFVSLVYWTQLTKDTKSSGHLEESTMSKLRQKRTPQEKFKIVMEGLRGDHGSIAASMSLLPPISCRLRMQRRNRPAKSFAKAEFGRRGKVLARRLTRSAPWRQGF